jgi:hypothetical protein
MQNTARTKRGVYSAGEGLNYKGVRVMVRGDRRGTFPAVKMAGYTLRPGVKSNQ